MIIEIDMGHYLRGGARGIVGEVEINRKVGKLVIEKLRAKGNTVIDCTCDYADNEVSQLEKIVKVANAHKADLFCSIHLNAGGGHGTEVFTMVGASQSTKNIAKRVDRAIVESCNFTDRGIKEENFYVLRKTTNPAILCELFFCDSKEDCNKFNVEKIAEALANAIDSTPANNTISDEAGQAPEKKVLETNAKVINDFFYLRDENGTKTGDILEIGTRIRVDYIYFETQLVRIEFVSKNGEVETAYITNAVNCIAYDKTDAWVNGTTNEFVYEDANTIKKIGTIYPEEKATILYKENGFTKIAYTTVKGVRTKTGFVAFGGK